MGDRNVRINVPLLARVEGEGALDVRVKEGRIDELKLVIFEPPRLFEKFLEGRPYREVPDAVSRICGLCPVAYQMSASHAIEDAFGTEPGPWVREMRRLFYCGEWLQSHAVHMHLLAVPDFLGFNSVIEMAAHYPEEVRRGLEIQEIGNAIIRLFGQRSVHPVGTRVGGFYHAPQKAQVEALLERLHRALPLAEALVAWTATLEVPDDPQEFVAVSLRHPDEYPMNEGRLVSSEGLDIDIADYQGHFEEFQVPHSSALHALLEGKPYLVGPLARLNLNLDRLPQPVRDTLARTGVRFPSSNMFHSALARAVEVHYAIVEAIRICEAYQLPETPYAEVRPRAGIGYGCTEAPRGILWHAFAMDDDGRVVKVTIIPPTSQNQARMEQDLRWSLERLGLEKPDEELRLRGEMVIRNYDPCISCSCHFLKLNVERL